MKFENFLKQLGIGPKKKRSGRKIWENCELSNFLFILCYVSRTKRNGVRA